MGTNPYTEAKLIAQTDTEPGFEPNLVDESIRPDFGDDKLMAPRVDGVGNKLPDRSTELGDLPEADMEHPVGVSFGKELCYASTLTELIRCECHRNGSLQPVLLPKTGPNTA